MIKRAIAVSTLVVGFLAAVIAVPEVHAASPCIQVEKQVSVDFGFNYADADMVGDSDVPIEPAPQEQVVYQLLLTNCGDVELQDLTVDDSRLEIHGRIITDPRILGVRETLVVDSETIFEFFAPCLGPGVFDNVATVTAQSVEDPSPSGTVTDTDSAVLICTDGPAIQLRKQISVDRGANFFDADAPGDPDVPRVPSPSDALYRLVIANVGSSDLHSVTVNDPGLAIDSVMLPDMLPVGAVVTVTEFDIPGLSVVDRCTQAGDFGNTAFVTALSATIPPLVFHADSAWLKCLPPTESCELSVEKRCVVVTPPSGDLLCQSGIAATLLRYTGPERLGATVEFQGSNGPLATYAGIDLKPGTILSATSQNGFTIDALPSHDKLGSKTFIHVEDPVNGVLDEVIHTSCSAIYEAGRPAPLDAITPNPPDSSKGDPSPNWFVEAFVDKDGNRVMMPASPLPASLCEIAGSPAPNCKGKLKSMSLVYTGGDCTIGPNDQSGKAECAGDALGAEPVSVVVKDSKKMLASRDTVGVGDVITLSATGRSLPSTTRLDLRQDGTILQSIAIHTSCSKPLNLGDRFGSLEVVALDTTEGGVQQQGGEVEYLYKVENIGGVDVVDLTVTDDVLGEVPGSPVDALGAGETVTMMAGAFVDADVTNTVTVVAETASGQMCEAQDSATVLIVDTPIPPASCADGKPTELVFEYTGEDCSASNNQQKSRKSKCSGDPAGAEPVRVVTKKHRRHKKLTVTPSDESLHVGDLISIARARGKKDLGKEIKLEIRQGRKKLQSLKIHTSCSRPLSVGDQFGSLILRKFIPKN